MARQVDAACRTMGDMTVYYQSCPTPLGAMWLAADADGLRGAWFEDQADLPDLRDWTRGRGHALLQEARRQLRAYFARTLETFDLPLSPHSPGTAFQHQVWQALQTIHFGQLTHYGALATRLGAPQAARAVGAAVGRNHWSVIVPCHRVVGARGELTGYAGGLERKVALLQREGHWLT